MSPTRSTDDGGDAEGDGPAVDGPAADAVLEAELRALRPVGVPAELAARIGRGIDANLAARGRPWRRWAAAGLGLAASVAVALLVWRIGPRPGVGTGAQLPTPPATTKSEQVGPTVPPGPRPVTLAACRVALARSPAALDALLDADARRPFASAGGTDGPRPFQLTGGPDPLGLPN